MPNKVITCDVSGDFNVAGNWAPAGVPADGDHLIANHQMARNLDANLAQAAKEFSLEYGEDCNYSIGANGNPLIPANGFTDIWFNGAGNVNCYVEAGGGGDIDRIHIDSKGGSETAFVVEGGTVVNMSLRQGKAQLAAGVTLNGRLQVGSQGGQTLAQMTIPAGCTVNAAIIGISGGTLMCSSNVGTVNQAGGQFTLDGTATMTLFETSAGEWLWHSTGTVTTMELRGTASARVEKLKARTLTNGRIYDSSRFDMRKVGSLLTLTNGIYVYGSAVIDFATGSNIKVNV